jgi:hypothetical protein
MACVHDPAQAGPYVLKSGSHGGVEAGLLIKTV